MSALSRAERETKQKPSEQKSLSEHVGFSVLSYNVNFGFARGSLDANAKEVLKAVRENPADIVAFQEVHSGWEGIFREVLGATHPYVHYLNDDHAAGGISVHSRFRLSHIRLLDNHKDIDGSWFPIWTGVVHLPNDIDVHFANVHLRPPINSSGWPTFVMPWNRSVRQEELQYLLKAFESPSEESDAKGVETLPVIIAGDFNESESERGLTWLKSSDCPGGAFVDAVEQYVPSGRETHRWPVQVPLYGVYWLRSRLDHIAYRDGSHTRVKCDSCRVIPGYEFNASDHQPLLARFQVQKVSKQAHGHK